MQGTQSTSLGFSEHLALAAPFFMHFALGDGYKLSTRIMAAVCLPLVFTVILSTQARLGRASCWAVSSTSAFGP